MPSLTPGQIVDELHRSDKELEQIADLYAWFKGQRDYWKAEYDLRFAVAKARVESRYGANEIATVNVSEQVVEIPWLPGNHISIPEMVRLTEASFDLIAKRYDYLERHIGILQSVNKNVMMDYQRSGTYD